MNVVIEAEILVLTRVMDAVVSALRELPSDDEILVSLEGGRLQDEPVRDYLFISFDFSPKDPEKDITQTAVVELIRTYDERFVGALAYSGVEIFTTEVCFDLPFVVGDREIDTNKLSALIADDVVQFFKTKEMREMLQERLHLVV